MPKGRIHGWKFGTYERTGRLPLAAFPSYIGAASRTIGPPTPGHPRFSMPRHALRHPGSCREYNQAYGRYPNLRDQPFQRENAGRKWFDPIAFAVRQIKSPRGSLLPRASARTALAFVLTGSRRNRSLLPARPPYVLNAITAAGQNIIVSDRATLDIAATRENCGTGSHNDGARARAGLQPCGALCGQMMLEPDGSRRWNQILCSRQPRMIHTITSIAPQRFDASTTATGGRLDWRGIHPQFDTSWTGRDGSTTSWFAEQLGPV